MTQLQQIQAATAYYASLLVIQYRGLPKASAQVQVQARAAIAEMILSQIGPAFDINTAVGNQLDILGKYIGVPRNIGPGTSVTYFGYRLAAGGGNSHGYTSAAGGVNLTAIYYRANSNQRQASDLTDVQYRFVLLMKIVLNSTNNTMYSIQNYIAQFFPGLISVVDNHNMTMTYTVSPDVPLPSSVVSAFLPAPMGVGITVVAPPTVTDFVTSGGSDLVTSGGSNLIASY